MPLTTFRTGLAIFLKPLALASSKGSFPPPSLPPKEPWSLPIAPRGFFLASVTWVRHIRAMVTKVIAVKKREENMIFVVLD